MDKQHRTFFFLSIAVISSLALALFLLFIPDMSATLINTVPEYPPEISTINEDESPDANAVTVDKTNVKNIVAAMSRPTEYFSVTQSLLSHSSGSATYLRQKWVKGDLSRVDIIYPSQQVAHTHYIYTKDHVFVWRQNDSSYYKTSRGSFEPDDAQMMMSYEDILLTKDEDIVAAQITMYDSIPCIYAETKSSVTGYTHRYWVSYSTGLLVHGQTLDKTGTVVYSITSTQTDISPQNIEVFRLPDGNLPTE